MIGPVQSRCHEGSSVGKRSLRWEGIVEKVDSSSIVRRTCTIIELSGEQRRVQVHNVNSQVCLLYVKSMSLVF